MLLQFAVENFRSFREEVVLNLAPVNRERIHKDHIRTDDKNGRKVQGLPLAVFYGANASGKSNLITAMDFARNLIVEGIRPEKSTGTVPFRLDPVWAEKPSRFEFVLKHEGVVYTYGFLVSKMEIIEEWLFAIIERLEVRLFERVTKNGKVELDIGQRLAPTAKDKQRLDFMGKGTRANQLFLTEAIERNEEQLKPLMQWFRESLVIIRPDSYYEPLVLQVHNDKQFTDFLASFLEIADTGIHKISRKTVEVDPEKPISGITGNVMSSILSELAQKPPSHVIMVHVDKSFYVFHKDKKGSIFMLTMQTSHQMSDGRSILFDTDDESDGTNRMMNLAPALLDLLGSEKVYVIDELDRSLHPKLCVMYIDAFLRATREGKSRGQIILTTHETALLDLELLRRDEIWFIEKDQKQSSRITSLAEFKYKVRADLKICKGYLNGRFGAIPFIGDINKLESQGVQS